MPSVTIYINKELYKKLQRVGDNESKIIQQVLEAWFEKLEGE